MKWTNVSDQMPKKEKPIITYDPSTLFNPKWEKNMNQKSQSLKV
jgi:hypothetical protein